LDISFHIIHIVQWICIFANMQNMQNMVLELSFSILSSILVHIVQVWFIGVYYIPWSVYNQVQDMLNMQNLDLSIYIVVNLHIYANYSTSIRHLAANNMHQYAKQKIIRKIICTLIHNSKNSIHRRVHGPKFPYFA
jgi:hypothetical protein